MDAPKILCVGPDLAVDRTILIEGFTAGRLYRPRDVLAIASGKGCNCARVLKTLGAQPTVLGWAGGHNGRFIEDGMRAIGVETHFIPISRESRVCTAIYDPQGRTLTEINEANPVIQPAEVEALAQAYLRLLPDFEMVTLSGRLPRGVPPDFYARLIGEAHRAGKPVLLDTYGASLKPAVRARPTLVKPNLQELSELLGKDLHSAEQAAEAAQQLARRHMMWVVVTLGEQGMVAAGLDNLFTAKAPRVKARIATGSGDAFLAGLAYGLASGEPFEGALRLGLAASAANTLELGAGVLRREQVEKLLARTVIRSM